MLGTWRSRDNLDWSRRVGESLRPLVASLFLCERSVLRAGAAVLEPLVLLFP
jgi:hypothetical protein